MFCIKNKKNRYTLVNPSFAIKVGSQGVFFSWTCFPDVLNIPQYFSVSDSQFVLGGLATLQRGDVNQQQLCEQIKQLKVSGSGHLYIITSVQLHHRLIKDSKVNLL